MMSVTLSNQPYDASQRPKTSETGRRNEIRKNGAEINTEKKDP